MVIYIYKIYGMGVDIQLFIITVICLKMKKNRNDYCSICIVH